MVAKKALLIQEAIDRGIKANKTWRMVDIREAINKKDKETKSDTSDTKIFIEQKMKKYRALCNVGGKYMPGTILTVGKEISEEDEKILLKFKAIVEIGD